MYYNHAEITTLFICLFIPRFASSNPAECDVFLRAIEIRGMTFFEREVKPSAHVLTFYGMLKIL
jgi:hypothetical protein